MREGDWRALGQRLAWAFVMGLIGALPTTGLTLDALWIALTLAAGSVARNGSRAVRARRREQS